MHAHTLFFWGGGGKGRFERFCAETEKKYIGTDLQRPKQKVTHLGRPPDLGSVHGFLDSFWLYFR